MDKGLACLLRRSNIFLDSARAVVKPQGEPGMRLEPAMVPRDMPLPPKRFDLGPLPQRTAHADDRMRMI